MDDGEPEVLEQLPRYDGTGPADRVGRFLDAVEASGRARGTRSEFEPEGLMGRRGTDGYYHELRQDDLRALLTGA